jgi:hypothetical protein
MTDERLLTPELAACEVHGMSRASFLLRGAMSAGAVYGIAAVGPFVSSALAQSSSGGASSSAQMAAGDAEILNFALTLEYLESDFYNVKGRQVGLSGQAKSYAKRDRAAARSQPDAGRRLRRAADQVAGARQGGPADQVLT